MKIHPVASLPHYAEHLRAITKHLPGDVVGREVLSIRPRLVHIPPTDIVMVAGAADIDVARDRRVVYVEHGAGQSYKGDPRSAKHPHYHGGIHPENVIAYIAPRHEVGLSWGRAYAAVGAPICDEWANSPICGPIAVISFHFPGRVCPEAGTALGWYEEHLGRMIRHLQDLGFEVYGHHHPREVRQPYIWKTLRVPILTAAEVRATAGLLVCDNSSLMYEMAHLGRAVVALNAPWFRREINHGLRFWDAVPGRQVEHAGEFLEHDWMTYMVSDWAAERSMLASMAAYDQAFADGLAGKRAARFLVDHVLGS